MRRFLADLGAALREVFHPQPWPEPDEDVVTPAAFRQWVASSKHAVTLDDLAALRAKVQQAWTVETAHLGWCGAADGKPDGQCGVTSAWLQEQLTIQSWFYFGTVTIDGAIHLDHCWLEIDGVVVDLTADQFGLPEVVYGAPPGVVYRGVPYPPPLGRLEVLKAALAKAGEVS